MKMRLWKKAVALLLGSTLLFGMTACGDSSPASSTADSGDTVKVGLLHSLSGTMAISETSVRDAELLAIEEINAAAPEASPKVRDYIVRHASGRKLSEKEEQEAQRYAQKLKYPKGALIFNGSGEEDFLYCLPDSKEISVCREMSKSFGFPILENGLSVLSKDDLADSLAYNSLKVRK